MKHNKNRFIGSKTKNPTIKNWENGLQTYLNTRVKINQRGKIGGKLEIEFYSEEELQEIINKILKSKN